MLSSYRLIPVGAVAVLALCSCATHPKQYQPPNPDRLKASTLRVSKAVDTASQSAKKARESVDRAAALAKTVEEETRALKEVPLSLLEHNNQLAQQLEDAQHHQAELELALKDATEGKQQVEKDKVDYFAGAKGLADDATNERNQRIAVEKKLSWYRWRWWGSWIVLGLGVLACGFIAFLKFTGRLAIAGMKL